jgi:hypothetical protein
VTRTRRRAGSSAALAVGALLGVALIAALGLGRRARGPAASDAATRSTSAARPTPAALRALFAEHLAAFVVALDAVRRGRADAAGDLAEARRAIEGLALGGLAAPVAAVLDAVAAGDAAPDPVAAVGRLDAALAAADLPFYVTFERLDDGDRPLTLLFAFAIERATRYQLDGRVVRALRLTRLDGLAFDYAAHGFTSPELADAIVLTTAIDAELAALDALVAERPALAAELATAPAARREQLARAVELHEVQHRLDLATWPPAMPPPLAALVGAPAMTGRFDHIAELALAELSAYLAELARSPTDARLRLALLLRAALSPDRAGDPVGYVAVVLLDALARELEVGDRTPLIARAAIVPRAARARADAILARSSGEVAAAAGELWRRWFGRPLPALAQVGPQGAP